VATENWLRSQMAARKMTQRVRSMLSGLEHSMIGRFLGGTRAPYYEAVVARYRSWKTGDRRATFARLPGASEPLPVVGVHISVSGLTRGGEVGSTGDTSHGERATGSFERLGNRLRRANAARDRDVTVADRDRIADARDEGARVRRTRMAGLARVPSASEASLMKQLETLRARAEIDRANAARVRARLEAELHSAHLDQLTGAYRREMGRLALSHEIERARRSDGRFVLAFVDVDGLKVVNDRDGHAAGDRVLESVVRAIRTRLRSFDPVIRYGGDEFVCGLSGTDLAQAERRFDSIGVAIEADTPVSISVGLAALAVGETADDLTERADAAMLEVKARHHAREA
jgi:diguanylate cyclase (GGDEF)-like protein